MNQYFVNLTALLIIIMQVKQVSLKDIFLAFLKIGTFSFGGVYSMLSLFEKELIERRQWLTHEEFIDGVAIGQMTPGPPIVNTGICAGYKLKKTGGAVTAVAGMAFTGTVLAIMLAIFYVKTKDSNLLQSAMKGSGAAVSGLLLSVIYKMAVKIINDYKSAMFAMSAFFALAVLKINPVPLILAAGMMGLVVYGWRR